MLKEIAEITHDLRSSNDGLRTRIRELLKEKGVDPETAFLAFSFPENDPFEFGIVVTKDNNVFQYGYDFMHNDKRSGTFAEWNNMTLSYKRSPYDRHIEAAME